MRKLSIFLLFIVAAIPCMAADSDGNGIDDAIEATLAQKFCPSYVLHSQDQSVSPEDGSFEIA